MYFIESKFYEDYLAFVRADRGDRDDMSRPEHYKQYKGPADSRLEREPRIMVGSGEFKDTFNGEKI